jgi:peptidoglycan/xylan/chitin deacetylase (PgdA/CDA1 family)
MAILVFHHADEKFHLGLNNFSQKRFRHLLKILIDAGIGFLDLKNYWELDNKSKTVSITFDDGMESFYYHIWPILSELSIPCTIFIPAGFIGKTNRWDYVHIARKSNHLTHHQIKELSENNIDIGSHGLSHTSLIELPNRLLNLELTRSKKILEDITGKYVDSISYPFGRYNSRVEQFCSMAGYKKGLGMSAGVNQGGFTIARKAVYSMDTPFSIFQKISKGFFSKIEEYKGKILNQYSYGTVIYNQLRSFPQILD